MGTWRSPWASRKLHVPGAFGMSIGASDRLFWASERLLGGSEKPQEGLKGYVDSASFFRINSKLSAHCALRPNLGCLKEKKSSRTNVRCLMSYTGHDQFIRSDPGSNPFQTKKTNCLSVAPHFALAPPRH